jgi:hypothetical protein
MDRSDAIVMRWRYEGGRNPRRLVFEPTSDGCWLREEHVRVGAGEWRRVGRERVDSIGFEGPVPGEPIDGIGVVGPGGQ